MTKNKLFVIVLLLVSAFTLTACTSDVPTTKKQEHVQVFQEKSAMVGGDDLDELSDSRINVWATAEMLGKETPIAKIPNKSDVIVIDEKEVTNELDQKITYYKIRYKDTEGWVGQNIVTFE